MKIRNRALAIAVALTLTVGTSSVATAQGLVEYTGEPSCAGKLISTIARTPDVSPTDFIGAIRAQLGRANGWGQFLRLAHQPGGPCRATDPEEHHR